MSGMMLEVVTGSAEAGIPWGTVLPTLGAVAAAVIAGLFAWSAQRTASKAERARRIEEATAGRRRETYEPVVEHFAKVLDPRTRGQLTDADHLKVIGEGSTWLSIYGSDDAVMAFHKFMQAAYVEAPGPIAIRLYAEFVLAARRDVGLPASKLSAVGLLGMRLNDLYANATYFEALTLPFDQLCKRMSWTPPWKAAVS